MTEITEYLKQIGSKGGSTTKAKYGKEHYQKLAANMNAKRWGKKEVSQPAYVPPTKKLDKNGYCPHFVKGDGYCMRCEED